MTNDHHRAVQTGDVTRTDIRLGAEDWMNLYLGSGRCGGSFNRYGMMNRADDSRDSFGVTTLMHADHWHHGELGIDFHLPLARILFARRPPDPHRYFQRLDLVTGALTTEYAAEGCAYQLRCSFNPDRPDLLGLEFTEISGKVPELLVVPEADVRTSYGDSLSTTITRLPDGFESRSGTAHSAVLVRVFGSRAVISGEGPLTVGLSGHGRGVGILIALGSAQRSAALRTELDSFPTMDAYFESSATAWRNRWGVGFLQTDDDHLQRHWARSMFWILSSFGPDVRCPAPAMGWSGNGWQFNFPQDLSYVSPALLELGHTDVVKSWIEFYAGCVPFTREFTQRIYGVPGTLWAWEHPIGCEGRLLDGVPHGTPNWFQHEIHNAAYPAQMAYETAVRLRDRRWLEDVAWPVIRGSAEFFAHAATQETDGPYSIDVKPAMGQNEFDEPNRRNYLCSLFAAASTLARGLAVAQELGVRDREIELWSRVLDEGLAFTRLFDPAFGMYATSEGDDTRVSPGTQKHPIQLDPLFSLPLRAREWAAISAPTLAAYADQETLCRQGDGRLYDGWTLPALALSAARTGDGERSVARIRQLQTASLTDAEGVQLFESSLPIFRGDAGRAKCYYTTNAGIVATTLHSLVHDEFAAYTAHDNPLTVARDWRLRTLRT
jgi:hypothetical protein